MKVQEVVYTVVLADKIDISEFSFYLFKKVGVRFILDGPDQTINGYLNSYLRQENNQLYTVIDMFLYDGKAKMASDDDKRVTNHKIKGISFDEAMIAKIKKTIKSKYELAPAEIANVIINKLGININSNKNEIFNQ